VAIIAPLSSSVKPPQLLCHSPKTIDGDTLLLKCLHHHKIYKARLSYIDAPERMQFSFDHKPIGQMATLALAELTSGETLKVTFLGNDHYQRKIGHIHTATNNTEVNLKLVHLGMALLYPFANFSSSQERASFIFSYELAKLRRVGLWGTAGFQSPYHYRRERTKTELWSK
jgi:endonuclease YncB( thermonuclease family)